ncbi:MAG: RHS repeat protein [Candidatus Hydrogenedentes bacterium]|nr:RHS repeat protein [Candidatus Hydrogenedentota bacterium]
MTKVKNALNQETDFVYDCLGRRVTTTFPSGSGNHMITEYDLLGLATKTIDLAGNYTLNYFDERGRLTKSTLPVIGDVKYFYDATGLKTKVTDALNHSTEYFFDYTRHLLTRTLDAVGKELKYYYDAVGRVTKTGAGSSGDIMPTLNYYDGATGMMPKVRYSPSAESATRTRPAPRRTCSTISTKPGR